jgi:lipopolysaccharide export system permease protein
MKFRIRKTDLYVIGNFLGPFILCLFFLVFMMHVTELFDRLSYFTSVKVPLGRILFYFLCKSPFLICELMPIAALFATVFSLAEMSRNNETIAILSAGTSFYRIIFPLLGVGLFLVIFTIGFNDFVVPPSSKKANQIGNNFTGKFRQPRVRTIYNVKRFGMDNAVFFADRYIHRYRTLYGLTVVSHGANERIDAESATWDAQRNLWILSNARVSTFVSNRLVSVREESRMERNFKERPVDFRKEDKAVQDMTIAESADFIQRLKRTGFASAKEEVEFNWKISFPFGILVMILIGAPLSGYSRRNILISSFFYSFLVTLVYYNTLYLGYTLGKNEVLPPLLAAWIGNLVFSIPVIWLLRKVRT